MGEMFMQDLRLLGSLQRQLARGRLAPEGLVGYSNRLSINIQSTTP
jgi:hypothetical protein